MLRLTSEYVRQQGPYGIGMRDIVADNPEQLQAFLREYKGSFHTLEPKWQGNPESGEFEKVESAVEIKTIESELAEMLVLRYNMYLGGKKEKADKIEFLDQCAVEAVTAIIYATDLAPRRMPLAQYAGLVITAHEHYGDSDEFGKRILELLNCQTPRDFGKAAQQVELFSTLLFRDENTKDEETEE